MNKKYKTITNPEANKQIISFREMIELTFQPTNFFEQSTTNRMLNRFSNGNNKLYN